MAILTYPARRTALMALALAVLATPALAQDLSPVNTFFTTLGTALTGTTGRAIGLVALAGVGLMFLTGRMNWGFALSICLGLVILYGAGTILGGIA
ncbi:TrbC/VirB2 family protein [Roseitranquillus sediminis]|uniref:TrbC/VirB2 family protein n=1 Tax=Roseitranquillus sediminis TaxID=2809051 RepID=UPI001D0C5208|nr:TrbC/VirB2 family protein [Roseitranquillus sediminis]MBM9595048.1 TrbC/VirB2 family protein [Roseitranquillus sediminis]